MEQHGITETDQVFSKYYDLTAVEDYELFKRTIIGYYNSYVQAFPYEPKPVECKDGTTMIKAIVPKPISTEEVMIKYPEKYWFRLYFKIRNIESDSALSPTRFEHVYRNLSNMLDSYYMRDILSLMETTMADLSDETGSMHRFLERVDALGDEAAERVIATTEATTIESADVGVDLLEVTGRTDY